MVITNRNVAVEAVEMAIVDVERRIFDEHDARQQSVDGEWWEDVKVADAFIAHYNLTLKYLRADLAQARGKVAA